MYVVSVSAFLLLAGSAGEVAQVDPRPAAPPVVVPGEAPAAPPGEAPAAPRGEAPFDVSPLRQVPSRAPSAEPPAPPPAAAPIHRYPLRLRQQLPLESRTSLLHFVTHSVPGARPGAAALPRLRSPHPATLIVDGFTFDRERLPAAMVGDLEVIEAGHGADRADAPGGLLRFTTTPAARFSASVDSAYERGRGGQAGTTLVGEPRTNGYVMPTLSGPLAPGLLSFLAAASFEDDEATGPADLFFPGRPTNDRRTYRAALRFDLTPTGAHRFFALLAADRDRVHDRRPTEFEEVANPVTGTAGIFTGLGWDGRFGDAWQGGARLAYRRTTVDVEPLLCARTSDCIHIPSYRQTFPRDIVIGNGPSIDHLTTNGGEATAFAGWSSASGGWFRDHLRFGARVDMEERAHQSIVPGDTIYVLNGTTFDRVTWTYANDPRLAPPAFGPFTAAASAARLVLHAENQLDLGRSLALTAGGAVVGARATSSNARLTDAVLTPHVRAVWDATGDGRTVVRGGVHRRADADLLSRALHVEGEAVQRECRWSDETQAFTRECRFKGGAARGYTLGLPCSPTGFAEDGTPCVRPARIPAAWEYTAGVERALWGGIALHGDVVYRRSEGVLALRETNRIWTVEARSRVPNAGYRNRLATDVDDLSLDPRWSRRHLGVTTGIRGGEGPVSLAAAHTFFHRGDEVPTLSPLTGTADALAIFPAEPAHQLRALAVYQPLPWASVGFLYRYESGAPLARYLPGDRTIPDADFGADPSRNIDDPGVAGARRGPDSQQLGLQLAFRHAAPRTVSFEVFADLLNVLHSAGSPTTNDVGTFASPGRSHRSARLGLRLLH